MCVKTFIELGVSHALQGFVLTPTPATVAPPPYTLFES